MKKGFSRKQLLIPYAVFLILFVVLPLFVIFSYGFTDKESHISVSNLVAFFQSRKTIGTLIYSLVIAFVTTLLCLFIAYPVAYILAKSKFGGNGKLLLLLVLPMWINFTLRITALKEILDFLEGNLAKYSYINTIIGMTYDFLPFMILPIYNSLTKLDDSFIEAAKDLGANTYNVFVKVVIPLSVPGILSGVTMVFLPAMTNYVVLDMMHNSTFIMGSLIGSYFSTYDWHNGSVISIILLVIIGIITYISNKFADPTANEEMAKLR